MAEQKNYTYVYFRCLDYTGAPALSTYTLDITPLTCIPDFTTATLLSSNAFLSNRTLRWDFGDGTTSNELTAVHQYTWPGQYKIMLNVFDSNGNVYENLYTPIIKVFNFVEDDLNFKDYGRFIYDVPASKIIDPLVVQRTNSFQTLNSLTGNKFTINLYASGALGSYIDINTFYADKWSHLRSLSRFYEKQTIGDTETFTVVTAVTTKDVEIYARINNGKLERCQKEDQGSVFAGTTGYAELYYVDDRTKNFSTREAPIFVFATAENSDFNDSFTYQKEIFKYVPTPPEGFQTLQTAVQPIIKVRHNPASKLSITTTGIDGEGYLSATNFNMPKISWQNTQIPFVIKMKDNENFTTRTYPTLSCLKIDNNYDTTGNLLTTFNLQVDLVQNDVFRITDVDFYNDFSDDIPRSIGSFYKGYFIPKTSNLNCKLTAGMMIIDPVNFPKDSLLGWIAEPNYQYVQRIFKTTVYNYCGGTVVFNLSGKGDNFVTPNSAINSYCIAIAPSGAGIKNDYQAWIGDAVSNILYKLDVYGNILSSFSLSSYPVSSTVGIVYTDLRSPVLSNAAPSSLALDSKQDLWVALFDSVSCIKINFTDGVLKNYAYPTLSNLVEYLSSDYNIVQLSGYAGENTLLPSSLDTDINDNIWVSYTHPVSNFLMKYSTYGSLLTVIPFPTLISPIEIVVDRDNYVWLTAMNNYYNPPNINDRNDLVYKFNLDGALVNGFPVSGVKLAGNITVDGNQNAYIAHGTETLTKIDKNTGAFTNFAAGTGNNISNYICSIGGIAGDTGNFIWVLNNFDKKIYYFDCDLLVQPISSVSYLDIDFPTNVPSMVSSAFEEKRFQAYGDWNGSRWINKYMVPYSITRYVSGESVPFDIHPDSGEYNLQKINEDFNAKLFYDDLRYQEILVDKNVFFDEFLGTIVGGLCAQPYELGKTVYEKIANFNSNIADVGKCNLDDLLSFCYELGVQFEQYNYPFPPQLRRLVDILSIKHKILFGDKNNYKFDFNKRFTVNPNIGRNLGSKISPLTGVIYAGVPIVAHEYFSDIYTLVNYSIFEEVTPSTSAFPLSNYNYNWGWGLVAPKSLSGSSISDYYEFYTYTDKIEGSFYNNIIDWKNPMNSLSPYISSYGLWSNKDGIMQNILSYELTKGLRLFTSAANIQYNN